MKNLLLLVFLGAYTMTNAQTQDSWKIKWGNKALLSASTENEKANTRSLKKTDLSKNAFLEIDYKEADPAKEKKWVRSFLFFDENDNELLRKENTRNLKLSSAELTKLFGDRKKLRIYTVSLPSDPALAATVRVRRVHLCSLELK
jgi:hypothetical protein